MQIVLIDRGLVRDGRGVPACWSAGWRGAASLLWMPPLVALAAVAAVVAGMLGTARAMFLSDHDFARRAAGSRRSPGWWRCCSRWGSAPGRGALLAAAAGGDPRFGEVGEFTGAGPGPAEFAELAAELTRTSQRLRGGS